MTTIFFFTRTGMSSIGGGGKHRSYQIWFDLQEAFGEDQIHYGDPYRLDHFPEFWKMEDNRWIKRITSVRGLFQRIKMKYRRKIHPLRKYPYMPIFTANYPERYQSLIRRASPPVVCVMDDARFSPLIPLNRKYGIPSIYCCHNIESFDFFAGRAEKNKRWHSLGNDLRQELQGLAQGDERLFISRVETGLISGFGLPSLYYPYVPRGDIKQRYELIREQRAQRPQQPGLFLLLGHGNHSTTRSSMIWLLSQIQEFGLPAGVELVVAGPETDTLLSKFPRLPGVTFRGWLEQAELDRLLVEVRAVLAPHRQGFGTLTRLAEMSCSGVPIITSPLALYALDCPPGVLLAGDSWEDWRAALQSVIEGQTAASAADYHLWESRQPRPLADVVSRWLGGV